MQNHLATKRETRAEQEKEEDGGREREREREGTSKLREAKPKTKPAHTHPEGPVLLLTPYVPRRLNVPLYAEIMKITNSPACTCVHGRMRSGVHHARGISTSKVSPMSGEWTVVVAEHAAPWTYRKLSAVIFVSEGRGSGRQETSHRVEYIRSADK